MTTREQLTFERVKGLVRMVRESGASAPSDVPPEAYIDALERTREHGDADAVADAHAASEAPPRTSLDVPAKQTESVDRSLISEASKQDFLDARAAGDVQTQLDTLYAVLTGEQPGGGS